MHDLCVPFGEITKRVVTALDGLNVSFEKLQEKGKALQKVGRTHLGSATFIIEEAHTKT